MSFCSNYNFEIDTIVKFIKERKATKILLQLPEGLQQCALYIEDALRERLGQEIEIYISQNPSYGSCLIDEYGASELGVDAIIHIGHVEYAFYKPKIPTLFIKASYIGIDKEKIRSFLQNICREYAKPICVATTAQHDDEITNIVKDLSNCITYKGIVLGCKPINDSICKTIVIVAGGKFHCLAQALYTYSLNKEVKVLCIDPYINSFWDPIKDVEKILRVRLWKVVEAFNANNWLIIDGFYGQHREELLKVLINNIKKLNKRYTIVKALKIGKELLDNIAAEKHFDAIVVVACPYIAFDLANYEKPVLTVGEALMALNKSIERYIYPW